MLNKGLWMNEVKNGENVSFITRLQTTPCLKTSCLYGINGGLGIGLAHFLFTSNVSRALKYGHGGFMVFLFGTWGVCRYHHAQERFKTRQWQKATANGTNKIQLIDPKDV
ncbi:unnamed protein product [Lymnaea stagnalis]|uniref:Cytochrome c oxidase assembly protein COX20, mitochondrial n=1 Tax=Lymnaea stagnalis TaxID=6523 RepID=A0AAV2ID80_LYMST